MTNTTATVTDVTRTCQDAESFTTAELVATLERAWAAIRAEHPDVPPAVIVVGSGSPARKTSALKYGHFASLRWQLGETRLPEVLVSGEGLRRSAPEVLTTLLHEAVHALAEARGVKDTSRQGRWHNKQFATLAGELGLVATKDARIGWSVCTLLPDTAGQYRDVIDALGTAMRAYRHTDELATSTRSSNNNGLSMACACPRKIRVAAAVADEGSIVCGVCDTAFVAED